MDTSAILQPLLLVILCVELGILIVKADAMLAALKALRNQAPALTA
jgi:hypothetical protein